MQNSIPLLSIVTPVLNGEKWIKDHVNSIDSLCIPYEHIIVDGGSTDKTLSIIYEYPKNRVILHQNPGNGMYHAVCQGIVNAKGLFIMHLNSDDYLLAEPLSSELQFLRTCKFDVIVYGGILFGTSFTFSEELYPPLFSRFFASKGIIPTIQPSVIFRRSAYFKHMHDLTFKVCADGEMLSRMAKDISLSWISRDKLIVKFLVRPDSFGNSNSVLASQEIKLFSRASIVDRVLFLLSKYTIKCFRALDS
jgi:glycosyltransferase involved in cell wall biosynthesis